MATPATHSPAPHSHDTEVLPTPIPWGNVVGAVPPLDGAVSSNPTNELHGMRTAGEALRRIEQRERNQERSGARRPVRRAGEARRLLPVLGARAASANRQVALAPPAAKRSGPRSLPVLQSNGQVRKDPPAAAASGAVASDGKAGTPAKAKKSGKKRPGSGIPARPMIRFLVWARRVSQIGFFALFTFLLAQTTFRGTFAANSDEPVRLPHPVEAFLSADPFVAAMTLLSTHQVYRGLAWSLVLVVLTLVVGRAFCGWMCPFGTIHHFTAWLFPSRYGKGTERIDANKTHWWQVAKYYLMVVFLAAALTGSAIGGLMDPICIAVRALGLGVLPGLQYLGLRAGDALADSNARVLQGAADSSQDFLARTLWTAKQFYFHQTWLIVFLLVGILFMNRLVPRFWCRALCPLGAFLGVMSRFALFGMEKDHKKCTDCNLCLTHCQGGDSPQGGVKHQQDECHLCFNCEAACPEDVIKFKFLPDRTSLKKTDLKRRTVMATGAAGALAIPGMRIGNWPDRAYSEKVIRPPGSVEEREFLERCIRCAECMKVCPNNALHPAFFEAGIEGLWTPILVPRIGYCEFSCVLCGQVCPTGAIQKITEKQKMGIGQKPLSIGTAMYDQGRCLPWAMATPCIVCEEFCPTSPKAIWAEEVEVPKRDDQYKADGAHPEMLTVKVQRPHVDPSLCIGCGACEKVCPIVDKPAVYVTSAGETRSKTNIILLENTNYNAT